MTNSNDRDRRPVSPTAASSAVGVPSRRPVEAGPVGSMPESGDEDLPPPTTLADEEEAPVRRVDQEWDDSDGDEGDEAVAAARPTDVSSDDEGAEQDEFSEEGDTEGDTGPSGSEVRGRADRSGPGGASPQRGRVERRPFPSSADEIFTSEIPFRLQRADAKLRQHLTGTILVKVASGVERRGGDRKGGEARYLVDWSTEAAKTSATSVDAADCVVSIHEQTLLRIANGELNPQIVMLSDRVRIEGQATLAIYFFNLVAPLASLNAH